MPNTDVTPGWESRYTQIRTFIRVDLSKVITDIFLLADAGIISMEEAKRSAGKVKLLEPFVTRLVTNMVKGTLKYPTDNWDINTWLDMGMDDQADSVNYSILLKQAILRDMGNRKPSSEDNSG